MRKIFVGGSVLIAALACSSPQEKEGRIRNAAEGSAHALELNACYTSAQTSDAGNQYALYEACAAGVDRRYGRK
jgi:hypothetical protein